MSDYEERLRRKLEELKVPWQITAHLPKHKRIFKPKSWSPRISMLKYNLESETLHDSNTTALQLARQRLERQAKSDARRADLLADRLADLESAYSARLEELEKLKKMTADEKSDLLEKLNKSDEKIRVKSGESLIIQEEFKHFKDLHNELQEDQSKQMEVLVNENKRLEVSLAKAEMQVKDAEAQQSLYESDIDEALRQIETLKNIARIPASSTANQDTLHSSLADNVSDNSLEPSESESAGETDARNSVPHSAVNPNGIFHRFRNWWCAPITTLSISWIPFLKLSSPASVNETDDKKN